MINARLSLQLISDVKGRLPIRVAPFELRRCYVGHRHVRVAENVGRYIANYSQRIIKETEVWVMH